MFFKLSLELTTQKSKLSKSITSCKFHSKYRTNFKSRLPRGDENNLPKVDSVVSLWKAANFQERETYDMLGVEFVGHPDHRRIICPVYWTGFPLRKDYVVQEKYLDMVVNPVHKMNIGEREFGAKHTHIKGASTSVKNYEVEAPATSDDTTIN